MNRNRTQEEIDYENTSFQNEVYAIRNIMNEINNTAIELTHAIRHQIVVVNFRG